MTMNSDYTPFTFHMDTMKAFGNDFLAHWHENIEVLFVIQGAITVMSDANAVTAYENDIVIVNSNNVHHIHGTDQEAKYYCLVLDKRFCGKHGVFVDGLVFNQLVKSEETARKYLAIRDELVAKQPLYQVVVKSLVVDLLIHLFRHHGVSEALSNQKRDVEKIEIMKKAIQYMEDNYRTDISITDIASYAGLSKYYFCRTFKEFTGCTIVFYLNILRCVHARKLLQTGKYRVEEAALVCGFENLSYFTKTYKKYMGCLPSDSKKDTRTRFPIDTVMG